MDGFEWDPEKAAANVAKHEVEFADAAAALSDDMALTRDDPDAEGEQRFVTVAMDPLGRLLVVVYAEAGPNTRIISARRASPGETKAYGER